MTRFWPRSSRARFPGLHRLGGLRLLLLCVLALLPHPALAKAPDDALSQKEVDTLRDTAFTPPDRVLAFAQFLNDREKGIATLIAKRRGHTDYGGDMHDALDQFGAIVSELNDNLDDYARLHRDIRKVLPKLLAASDHWIATLNGATHIDAYNVVRRIALDNLKDTRELTQTTQTELDAYFKAHPEAAQAEKKRNTDPHAVRPE